MTEREEVTERGRGYRERDRDGVREGVTERGRG